MPGSFLGPIQDHGIMILSLLELLNISSFWLFFELKSVTGTIASDVVFCILVLLIINYVYFFPNKRYDQIIRRCKQKSSKYQTVSLLVTVSYVFLTVFLFYMIHTGKFTK